MRRVTAERGLVPGDVVRAAAVGSLAVGVVTLGGIAGALFFLASGLFGAVLAGVVLAVRDPARRLGRDA